MKNLLYSVPNYCISSQIERSGRSFGVHLCFILLFLHVAQRSIRKSRGSELENSRTSDRVGTKFADAWGDRRKRSRFAASNMFRGMCKCTLPSASLNNEQFTTSSPPSRPTTPNASCHCTDLNHRCISLWQCTFYYYYVTFHPGAQLY